MGLDDPVGRHAGGALEAVDVLGEELVEEVLLREQGDEDVRDGGAELARVELAGEDVEGLRAGAEEGDVEDGLGVGEVQAGEVRVEPGAGGAEVGDCGSVCVSYIICTGLAGASGVLRGCLTSCRRGDAGPRQYDDAARIAFLYEVRDGAQGAVLQCGGRGSLLTHGASSRQTWTQ